MEALLAATFPLNSSYMTAKWPTEELRPLYPEPMKWIAMVPIDVALT